MIKKIKFLLTKLISWWKDPSRRLEREYRMLLLEARNIQRNGDIPAFARKTREAEEIRKKIEEIKK